MRTLRLLVLVLPMLAGCATWSGYDGSRPEPPPAALPPSLDWRAVVAGDVLEVELTDAIGYYRVERVQLIGPAGQTYEAYELTRETVREEVGPYGGLGLGLGASIGSRSGGAVGLGLSFPVGSVAPAPLAGRTEARIRLPAPDAYRRSAGQWAIKIYLTDRAGAPSFAQIPAPSTHFHD